MHDASGGPNHGYSLADARNNFIDHGDMYELRDDRRISVVATPSRHRLAILQFVMNVDRDERFDMETFEQLMSRALK